MSKEDEIIKAKKETMNKVFGCLGIDERYLKITDNYPAMMYPIWGVDKE